MARYEYRCEDGGETFELRERISEHETVASTRRQPAR